jgi:Mg-chelatase subunit ChlD
MARFAALVGVDPLDRRHLHLDFAAAMPFCGSLFQLVFGAKSPSPAFISAKTSTIHSIHQRDQPRDRNGAAITPEEVLSRRTTIILTLDISRSMCMQDIRPNRLEVARATALSFIQHPVLGTQVGIVAFAGFAELAQAPTTHVELLENTITNLTTGTETAIGSAILQSLDASGSG